MNFRRLSAYKTPSEFQEQQKNLQIEIPIHVEQLETQKAILSKPLPLNERTIKERTIGNRFAVLPMEGWDGTTDGRPTELTKARWRHFGESTAKLIWGGEAVAVRPDGRANPNQLMISPDTMTDLEELKQILSKAHEEACGQTDDLYIGLQLTHSGRFARPYNRNKLESKILYNHPLLDDKFQLGEHHPILSDSEIDDLIGDFIIAAKRAAELGFDFVDIKHCHGYLGHEFLSAVDRPGKYGGSLENRMRFLSSIVAGIRSEAPQLDVGVRLSSADLLPFVKGENNLGEMATWPLQTPNSESLKGGISSNLEKKEQTEYRYAFGGNNQGSGFDLSEPIAFLQACVKLGIPLVCLSLGCPYYNPHLTRPAMFPPSDGYLPPEDPLVGVARHIHIAKSLKQMVPSLLMVGSGYSYLQEWLPQVAASVLQLGWIDSVGLGRMMLSYPQFPSDFLAGRELQRKKICRTFSDCTTAPRNGMVSGCYPLDPEYKNRPEMIELAKIKSKK